MEVVEEDPADGEEEIEVVEEDTLEDGVCEQHKSQHIYFSVISLICFLFFIMLIWKRQILYNFGM